MGQFAQATAKKYYSKNPRRYICLSRARTEEYVIDLIGTHEWG